MTERERIDRDKEIRVEMQNKKKMRAERMTIGNRQADRERRNESN